MPPVRARSPASRATMESAATTVPVVGLSSHRPTRASTSSTSHPTSSCASRVGRCTHLVHPRCRRQEREFEQIRDPRIRPAAHRHAAPPRKIHRTLPLLNFVNRCVPAPSCRAPASAPGNDLRHVLATPPRALRNTLLQYFVHRGLHLPHREQRGLPTFLQSGFCHAKLRGDKLLPGGDPQGTEMHR
jgi:hypothetical protein